MLIRKIAVGKWSKRRVTAYGRKNALFAGDAIADIGTSSDTISFWYAADDENDVNKIAMVLASNLDHLSKIVLVLIPESEFNNRKIEFIKKRGKADAIIKESILDMHRDLINVDYWHIGLVAEMIQDIVEDEKHKVGRYVEFSKTTVQNLLKKGIEDGIIEPAKLKPDVLKKVI